jgi:hypothetical protein
LKSSSFVHQLQQKGRILRPFLWGLMALLPTSLSAKEIERLGFEIDSLSYSEATSIHSIGGHWEDDVGAGDEALTIERLYLSYFHGPFSIQYVMRYDAYYDYANDTARLLYQVENKLPLQPGDQYELYIGADNSSSKGFRFGYTAWHTDDLEISAFFSLLELTDIEQGELTGNATAVGNNDYDFSFHSDLVYEDDPLYERESEQVSGQGYSFDLAIHYVADQNWDLNLEVYDLFSRMKVDDAPFTTADATSDIKHFDEDGYVTFDPVATGVEGNKSYTFEFNTQTHLAVGYRLANDDSVVLQHHHYVNTNFQELNYVQRFDEKEFALNMIPEFKAFGASFRMPSFSISLMADDLDYEEMKFLSFSLQYYWVFE